MEIGKIKTDILNDILNPLKYIRNEVLLRPGVGEDCSGIQLEKEEVIVLTSDPITGAEKNLGSLVVHICCNDLASSGAEPIGIMLTILMPPNSEESQLKDIMKEISEVSQQLNIDILGGHTEVTSAVNKMIISATAIGKVKKEHLISSTSAKVGDDLILTKTAGLEGTAIIANEKEEELSKVLSMERIQEAKEMVKFLSVIPEGKIGSNLKVNAMHDVTEGGVLGAVWELAEASKVGVKVFLEDIPLASSTKEISDYFHIDPLKLISSGCMLISAQNGKEVVDVLAQNNIKSSIIGKVTQRDKILITKEEIVNIEEPQADELYKVIK